MWRNRNIWIILTGEMIAGLGLWTGIIGNLEFMQEKIPSDFVKALNYVGWSSRGNYCRTACWKGY